MSDHDNDAYSEGRELSPRCALLKESVATDFTPTQIEELHDYAEYIGIDPENEPELIHLALAGLTAQLPEEWKAYSNPHGEMFYFNQTSGVSSWQHPTDEIYRGLVHEAKAQRSSGGVEDTSPVEVLNLEGGAINKKSFRARLYDVVNAPEAKVTAGSAVGGAAVLGGTGAVVGTTMGAFAGGAVGLVPAPFTFGLSIPVCAFIGGGVGLCAGTTTGASAGLVVGGAAGYGAYGQWKKTHTTAAMLTDAPAKDKQEEEFDDMPVSDSGIGA